NYFDLLRGIAGGLALVGGHGIAPSVSAGSDDPSAHWLVLGVQAAVLLVGLLLQTYRREHQRVLFFAPIFFLAGLSVSLTGAWPALFAFILVWSLNPILGKAQTFLAMYAVLIGAFGWLLEKVPEEFVVICIVLCLAPVLLSLLTRRPLVVFSRKAFHPEAGPA
ncbi:MAG TPA: hypothetical protein VHD62_07030, partial [Opitutaceae bacterium]|nr:hypothetical protein [Opitutaceae bacterium]